MRRSASSVRLYASCLRQVQGQASKSGPWASGLSHGFTGPDGERPASRSFNRTSSAAIEVRSEIRRLFGYGLLSCQTPRPTPVAAVTRGATASCRQSTLGSGSSVPRRRLQTWQVVVGERHAVVFEISYLGHCVVDLQGKLGAARRCRVQPRHQRQLQPARQGEHFLSLGVRALVVQSETVTVDLHHVRPVSDLQNSCGDGVRQHPTSASHPAFAGLLLKSCIHKVSGLAGRCPSRQIVSAPGVPAGPLATWDKVGGLARDCEPTAGPNPAATSNREPCQRTPYAAIGLACERACRATRARLRCPVASSCWTSVRCRSRCRETSGTACRSVAVPSQATLARRDAAPSLTGRR